MAFALLDHTEEKATIDEILTGTFREKDRQINFAIEELKKIKTEANIQAYVANIELDDYTARTQRKLVVDLDMVYKIIDNHISELKG